MLKRIFLLLLLLPTWVQAAHITDKLLAGMYAKPTSAEQPVQLLPSGTPIELIGEQAGFVKVQLVDGKTGWVEKRFLSADKPAKVRLLALQSKYRQLQAKLDIAEEALASLRQLSEPVSTVEHERQQPAEKAQQAELANAYDKIQHLERLLNQYDAAEFSMQAKGGEGERGILSSWAAICVALMIALVGGVLVGMRVQDARQLKRHGGFRV